MKKLLYISVNSKPENLSASKTVARRFIERFMSRHNDFTLEELDLYKTSLPKLDYKMFEKRNALINKNDFEKLSLQKQTQVQKINELCDQFCSADVIVFASPMWNLSFPAPLKEYLDCIIINEKTIRLTESKPEGLLKDKPRSVIYVQASGADINLITNLIMNRGVNYVRDIMKLMGIKKFEELLVDGTGYSNDEQQQAINKAIGKIDDIIENISEIEFA